MRRKGQAGTDTTLQEEVAKALAHMRPKVALRGLKRLVGHEAAGVRAEVMRSAGHLARPEGLTLIEIGLGDTAAQVREAAVGALARHGYPEAFDGLKRIFEASPDADAQRAVLTAMGKVKTFEAAEYLFRALLSDHHQGHAPTIRQSLETVLTADWRRIFANRLAAETDAIRRRGAFLMRA